MRNAIVSALFYCWAVIVCCQSTSEVAAQQSAFNDLYNQWHKALDAHRAFGEPHFFRTEGVPKDLAAAGTRIKQTGIAMTAFLCERVAAPANGIVDEHLYRDVLLLDEVTGINLWAGEQPTDNVGENIAELSARFKEEW